MTPSALETAEEIVSPFKRATRPEAPALFRVLACGDLAAPPARLWLRELQQVFIGRGAPAYEESDSNGRTHARIACPDRWMSSGHARFTLGPMGWVVEDAGSRNGTQVNGATVPFKLLADGDVIEAGRTFFLFREAVRPAREGGPRWVEAPPVPGPEGGLRTLSPLLEAEFERLRAVAASRLPVIVRGETGTGKEVAAGALHGLSGRSGGLQAVNCGAIPGDLLESELFGHVKGAFSGAIADKLGHLRAADKGTLFLDEVGELPLPAQAALLRALELSEVTPVGSTRPLKLDLRVVVATHRDLAAMAAAGTFREDLLARLSGLTVNLLPLRERREDLGLLIAALLARHGGEQLPELRPEAARLLLRHAWPHNVRELDRALAMALLLAKGQPLDVGHLPPALSQPPSPARAAATPASGVRSAPTPVPSELDAKDQERRARILELLEKLDGNVTAVARELDVARFQVQRWIRRYAIDMTRYRGG